MSVRLVLPHKDEEIDLPSIVVEEPDALKEMLSYETWSKKLSLQERHYLRQFLPKLSSDTNDPILADKNISEVFGDANFHFGNPVDQFVTNLSKGDYDPTVRQLKQLEEKAKFEQHQFFQRNYYYKLLNELVVNRQKFLVEASKIAPGKTVKRKRKRRRSQKNGASFTYESDAKYKKILYHCQKEAGVDPVSSDEEIPFALQQQTHGISDVLDILDAPEHLLSAELTDADYLKMLRNHHRRRRHFDLDPELDTSSVTIDGVISRAELPKRRRPYVYTGASPKPSPGQRSKGSAVSKSKGIKGSKAKIVKKTKAKKKPYVPKAVAAVTAAAAAIAPSPLATEPSLQHASPLGTDYVVRPLSDDEKRLFHVQERARFENPHKSFTYLMHGHRFVVGPIKGATTTKVREHPMLISDRPPVVNILSLVRDAIARLPNGEGTRAKVCVLLKESQFVSPTCTDQQIYSIVSGALDRLHYEKDPCVRYDSSRKVWVNLHGRRTAEEFERIFLAEEAMGRTKIGRPAKGKSASAASKNVKQAPTIASPASAVLAAPIALPEVKPAAVGPSTVPQIVAKEDEELSSLSVNDASSSSSSSSSSNSSSSESEGDEGHREKFNISNSTTVLTGKGTVTSEDDSSDSDSS